MGDIEYYLNLITDNKVDISSIQPQLQAVCNEYGVENVERLSSTLKPFEIVHRALERYDRNEKGESLSTTYLRPLLQEHPFFENRPYICAAPLTSIRFEFGGVMTVCCANREFTLGTYPEVTPLQAWCGERMREIRKSLADFDFSKGCIDCAYNIITNNVTGSIISQYDNIGLQKYINNSVFPAQLIFQIHNTCNYECIMCGGEFSSSIRKNRECLPSIPNAYTGKFVDDIDVFLKHVRIVEFLGGEPLLIPTNIKIMERLREINPNAVVNIISNGSILTPKLEKLFTDLPNLKIHISIDSVKPDTYKSIRRNGDLENVLKNVFTLQGLNRLGALSMCALVQNIYEVHDYLEFCIKHKIEPLFNNVDGALGIIMYDDIHENGNAQREVAYKGEKLPEFRLWKLPIEEKQKVKDYLLSRSYDDVHIQRKVDGLINFVMN